MYFLLTSLIHRNHHKKSLNCKNIWSNISLMKRYILIENKCTFPCKEWKPWSAVTIDPGVLRMFVKFNIQKKIVMSKCNGILLHCTVELDFAPKKKLQRQKNKILVIFQLWWILAHEKNLCCWWKQTLIGRYYGQLFHVNCYFQSLKKLSKCYGHAKIL